jgi:beta-lactamase superfamily II metal-dependent hydrolase
MEDESVVDAQKPFAVHLLDVGLKEYGDAVLCQFGHVSVLIDGAHTGDQEGKGGHESIPDQIGRLLRQNNTPYRVSLIIVSHAHEDHIGCLPHLVKNNILTADFALVADPSLGWGRTPDDAPTHGPSDARVRQVMAALREEIRTEGTDDATLADFLSDAGTLEDRYNEMLDNLVQGGTTVIRHGRDNPEPLLEFLSGKDITLRILGPSQDLLAITAEKIRNATDQMFSLVSDFARADDRSDPVALYRGIIGNPQDAVDAPSRPGAAINLQSIITNFEYKGKKFLFAGDMQFADPQTSGTQAFVDESREKVKQDGPFDFVKLSHHGSHNSFDEDIYDELNANGPSQLFGICAGENSTVHPHPETLKLLKKHTDEIRWARTDHNRQTTLTFKTAKPKIAVEQGNINDPRPNTDESISVTMVEPLPKVALEPVQPGTQTTASAEGGRDMVEVFARIPHEATRVTLTIDIEPKNTSSATRELDRSRPGALPTLRVGGGRQLPKLLFVTSKEGLARNIGQRESEHVLNALRDQHFLVFNKIPAGLDDASQAAALVRTELKKNNDVKGVVLLGGYDVVPSQRVDCLPPKLRAKVASNGDADNFIVWSDDVYGDFDGDLLPEMPVSRIPDGNRADLVFKAIQASGATVEKSRMGVRNVARPFADTIFKNLSGNGEMLVSHPVTYDVNPPYSLAGDRVYIMLHGDYTDSSRFWGEETDGNREAINVGNLPPASGAVVFTGCCWGALTVNTPAGRIANGRKFGQKSPDDSLAMSFLMRGATAFIGCTGAHYSPLQWPYKFFGGPMHEAFFLGYQPGGSPAQALFDAKLQYIKGLPHGQNTANAQAVEYKIFRQYTCLGLGW